MSALNIIQTSFEIWGCIISLIICLLTTSEVIKKKPGRKLWDMLLVNVLVLVSDSLAYVYRGDTSALGMMMTRISNFLLLFLEYVIILLFTHYVQNVLEENGLEQKRTWMYAVYILLGIMLGALIVTQFTGFYYYFDKTNHYCRGIGIILNFAGTCLAVLIALVQLVRMCKKIEIQHVNAQIIIVILPVVAILIQFVGYGVSLLNLALTVSIIIGYLQYYFGRLKADTELLIEDAKKETMQAMEQYQELKEKAAKSQQCRE